MKNKTVWISLLEMVPLSEEDKAEMDGAVTNGLTFASSMEIALKNFEKKLLEMGFQLIASEDTEKYNDRISRTTVSKEIELLAKEVKVSENTRFGTFHTWDGTENEELNGKIAT